MLPSILPLFALASTQFAAKSPTDIEVVGQVVRMEQASSGTIDVTGSAKLQLKPDFAEFSVTVVSLGDSVATARALSATRTTRLVNSLLKNGVRRDDIQTSNYSVEPATLKRKRFYKYILSYDVKVRQVGKAAEVLEAATNAGATEVSSLTFGVEETLKHQGIARKMAMDAAREKALDYARLAGVTLGPVLKISEADGELFHTAHNSIGLSDSRAKVFVERPGIESGAQEYSLQISVTYSISPKH